MTHTFVHDGLVHDASTDGAATFSPCRRYRYILTRTWDRVSPARVAAFVMLNPSTADALVLDPTIRRCVGFAKREGCTGLIVANLFAWRATDPDELDGLEDPYGPANETYIRKAIATSDITIAAWGAKRPKGHGNAHNIARTIAWDLDRTLYALRIQNSNPSHPLYLKATSPLVVYSRCKRDEAGNKTA